MTTFDAFAGGFRAARAESRRVRAARRTRPVTRFASFRRPVLNVAALGAIAAAAWTVALPLGLVATGVALFVLEWMTNE